MDIEQIREYALSLFGVTEDMPFGDDCVVFRVEGKIFLCLSLAGIEPHFALKLHPDRNLELRGLYDGIRPAYHWNKKHWSDVFYERFTNTQTKDWIKESYLLIIGTLPKSKQAHYLR